MERYPDWELPDDGSMDTERERACMGSALDYCDEKDELIEFANNIPNLSHNIDDTETVFERLYFVISKYQEQPGLLDPHIENFLRPCLNRLKNTSDLVPPQPYIIYSCKFVYIISKVRGGKHLLRWFPHEVSDMEPVLTALEQQDPKSISTWEVRYVLLLWMAIICIVPFDMSRFDSSHQRVITMDRILIVAKSYLDSRDKTQDAAVLLIGRFLARPDVSSIRLADFLDWCFVTLENYSNVASKATTAVSGTLMALSKLYKFGKRADLSKYSPLVLERITSLDLFSNKNMIVRKLNSKLLQRVGLSFLKARPATWRYQRGKRSLLEALDPGKFRAEQEKAEASNIDITDSLNTGDDDQTVPKAVEEVLGILLSGLSDKDTIVRWSAAKGLGRISSRLALCNADFVVQSILDFFTVRQSDLSWHGGCLALAELARRGVLLPDRLGDVMPVVLKSLEYDEKRGSTNIGSHVRDAGCFVCWAFARAYDPNSLQNHMLHIAQKLVTVSLFDRDVNCRKAASAAFQECVGRLGTFPHGIALVTLIDYITVSSNKNTYLQVCSEVGNYPVYFKPLVDHLANCKLIYWNNNIRELSAQALANLTVLNPDYMLHTIIPLLLPKTLSSDLQERHGVLLGVGYIVHALSDISIRTNTTNTEQNDTNTVTGLSNSVNIQHILGEDTVLQLQEIAGKLESAKLYRGLGGKILRPAVMKFIEKMCLSGLPITTGVLEVWNNSIYDNLQDPERITQERAVLAIKSVSTCVYSTFEETERNKLLEAMLGTCFEQLHSPIHYARMGFALALGSLPSFVLSGRVDQILQALIDTVFIIDMEQAIYTEARRDALIAINNICRTLSIATNNSSNNINTTTSTTNNNIDVNITNNSNDNNNNETGISNVLLDRIINCYFEAMNNYSSDNRGDIGKVVREVAMENIISIFRMIQNIDTTLLNPDWVSTAMCSFMKQANEKIDKTRIIGCNCIVDLLYNINPELSYIPLRKELQLMFPWDEVSKSTWVASGEAYDKTVQPLILSTYCKPIVAGLINSIGGLAESAIRASSNALLKQLKVISLDRSLLDLFTNALIDVFTDFIKKPKLLIPFFKMIDLLLTNSCFEPYTGQIGDFPYKLFKLTENIVKKTKVIRRVIASIDVFCGLLQFSGELQRLVLIQLVWLLSQNDFPRVRKITAEQFYLTLLAYDDLVPVDVIDEAMCILSEAPWTTEFEDIRPQRNRLCELLKISVQDMDVREASSTRDSEVKADDFSFKDFVERQF